MTAESSVSRPASTAGTSGRASGAPQTAAMDGCSERARSPSGARPGRASSHATGPGLAAAKAACLTQSGGARLLSVALDQCAAHRLRAPRCIPITLAGGDDGALHQDVPRVGERRGVAEARLGRECRQERPYVREVQRARTADRMIPVGPLEQDVDERAALEVVAVKPLVEGVEDREQLLLGRLPAAPRLLLDPLPRPQVLPLVEEREHEVVLGREVPVQRGLGDLGAREDLVDADGADAPPREELVGAVEDPLPRIEWTRGNRFTHAPSLPPRQTVLSGERCGREDLNLQGPRGPTGPKPVASTSSATPARFKDRAAG